MSSMDERIVKLTFDNKQFEEGVQTSVGSLEKLKNILDGAPKAAKGLLGLGKTAGKLAKGVQGMPVVGDAINVAVKNMSALGTIGDQVLRNLTNKAMSLAKTLTTAIPSQIISGGKRRAQNIAQAQFQLKGLMGDEYDWDTISKDLDYAVSGTAYGLDAAAKVASQLKASNINFGEDMKEALRGISGVAAMTNSTYEDIGQIFTTVAGQGKLMTDQLNQFAGRGLNVAAELAKTYNVSEAELRDMVTKGKVDFMTFSKAMNEAFGDHATKANETFTGALSNIKASLSRMGEKFATPMYEFLRKVFNSLLPIMKAVEKLIKPLADKFSAFLDVIWGKAEPAFAAIQKRLEDFVKVATNVKDKAEEIAKPMEELETVVQEVINGKYGNGQTRRDQLEELGWSYAKVQNRVNELLGCSKRWDEASEENTKSDKEQTKSKEALAKANEKAEKKQQKRLRKIAEEGSLLDKLCLTLLGVKAAIEIVIDAGKAIFNNLIKPFTASAVPSILDLILTKTSELAITLMNIQKEWKANDTLNKVFKGVADWCKTAYASVTSFITNAVNGFSRFKNMPGVVHLLNTLGKIKAYLQDLTRNAVNAVVKKFKEVGTAIKNNVPQFDIWETLATGAEWLAKGLDFLIGMLSTARGAIDDFVAPFIGSAFQSVVNFFQSETFINFFNSLVEGARKTGNSLRIFGENVVKSFQRISKLPGVQHLASTLSSIKDTVMDLAQNALGFLMDKFAETSDKVGDIKLPDVDVLSGFEKVVGFLADTLATLLDTISKGAGSVTDFLAPFGTAAVEKFGQFAGNVGNAAASLSGLDVASKVSAFGSAVGTLLENAQKSGSEKFQDLSKAFGDLIEPLKGGAITLLENAAKAVGNFIGSLGKGKDSDTSKFASSMSGISKAYDSMTGDPQELKTKASGSVTAILEGITDAIKGFDLTKTLNDIKLGASAFVLVQFGLMLGSIASAINQAKKSFKSIGELPKKANEVIDGFTKCLDAYQKKVKADALMKSAIAIGVLAAALAGLALFVPVDQLMHTAVALGAIMLALGVVVKAMSALMEAGNKKAEITQKSKEFEAQQKEAQKENPLVASLNLFVKGVNDFLSTISKAIAEAIKTVAKAGAFVLFGIAMMILVKVFLELYSFAKGGVSPEIIGIVVVSMIAMAAGLMVIMGVLSKIKVDPSAGKNVLLIAASMYLMSNIVKALGVLPKNQLIKGTGVVVALGVVMALIIEVLSHISSGSAKSIGAAAGAIAVITLCIGLLMVPIALLGFLPDGVLKKGTIAVVAIGIILSVLSIALGKLGDGGEAIKGAAAVAILAGAMLLLAPALVLLGAAANKTIPGVIALGIALGAMVFAGILAQQFLPGIKAITLAIAAFGAAALGIGLGVLSFSAGILVLTAAFALMGKVGPEAGTAVGAALGNMVAGFIDSIANIGDALGHLIDTLYDLFVTRAPKILLVAGTMIIAYFLLGALTTWASNATIFASMASKGVIMFAIGLVAAMPALVDIVVKLVVSFLNAIADALRDNQDIILSALANLFEAISEFLVVAVMDMLIAVVDSIPGGGWLADKLREDLEAGKEQMRKLFGVESGKEDGAAYVNGMDQGVKQEAPDLLGSLTELVTGAKKETKKAEKDIEELDPYGKAMRHQVKNVEDSQSDMKNAFGDLKDVVLGEADMSEVGGKLTNTLFGEGGFDIESIKTKAADGGLNFDLGFSNGVTDGSGDVQKTINDLATNTEDWLNGPLGINSPSKVTTESGKAIDEGLVRGITSGSHRVMSIIRSLVTHMLQQLNSRLGQFTTAGQKMGDNVASGIGGKEGDVKTASGKLSTAAVEGLSGVYNAMKDKGHDAGDGFIKGLDDKLAAARKKAKEFTKLSSQGGAEGQESSSPSKVWRRLAHYAADGYMLGFKDKLDAATAKAKEFTEKSAKAAEKPLSRIQSILDGEVNLDPTIRPVLDLSEIEEGASQINGLFPRNSLGLSFAAAGAIPGATMRVTNADVVSAIDRLNDRIDNMEHVTNNYTVGNVTYDDGSNVSTAVRSLVRAARVERRA